MKKAFLFFLSAFLYSPVWAAPPSFTVNMSEAVTVTGTPRIAVDVGGVTRYATYASGSGTSSLTFTYSPQEGDLDLDGISLSSPVDLNGGTITDLNGNPETNLTFTVPDTSGVKIDYPSLSMDFVNDDYILSGTHYNSLSSFLSAAGGTFSRNSVGTYFDNTGTMQTASANIPRFDYDPSTHTAKGILIEESKTNLVTDSESVDVWGKDSGTVAANVALAPDGHMTADKFTPNTSGAQHRVNRGTTLTAGQTYTSSVYVKKAGYDFYMIFWNAAGNASIAVNLDTGNVISTGGGEYVSHAVTALPNGWYRVSLTLTTAGGGWYQQLDYAYDGNFIFAGDGVSGIYIWGAQIEYGRFPSSYIPTTSATVTRSSDILNVPTGTWFDLNETTLYVSGDVFGGSSGGTFPVGIGTSSSNYLGFPYVTATGFFGSQSFYRSEGVGPIILGSPVLSFNTTYKAGYAFSVPDGTSSYSKNGVLSGTGTGISAMASATTLGIGHSMFAPSLPASGHIADVQYYPARVSDTQLQLLTQ